MKRSTEGPVGVYEGTPTGSLCHLVTPERNQSADSTYTATSGMCKSRASNDCVWCVGKREQNEHLLSVLSRRSTWSA